MKYNIDSHKLNYHPDVVAKLLNKETIVPANIEISPSGGCNLRCKFCSQAFLNYKPNLLSKRVLLDSIKSVEGKGLKAVVIAGEGEPLLNKELPNMIHEINECGIDIGLSTNALLMDEYFANDCLEPLKWVRISLNAGTNVNYNKIHGKPANFRGIDLVFENLAKIVEVKKKKNLRTTIGVQMVLIPENRNEMLILAEKLKYVGVDYFTIKPFSWHERMDVNFDNYVKLCSFEEVKDELMELQTESFNIILRENALNSIKNEKKYNKCYGLPLWSYISSSGDVWPCLAYIDSEGYKYGNIYEKNLSDIIHSEEKRKIDDAMMKMDISYCRKGCRLEAINDYLSCLNEDVYHRNFI